MDRGLVESDLLGSICESSHFSVWTKKETVVVAALQVRVLMLCTTEPC